MLWILIRMLSSSNGHRAVRQSSKQCNEPFILIAVQGDADAYYSVTLWRGLSPRVFKFAMFSKQTASTTIDCTFILQDRISYKWESVSEKERFTWLQDARSTQRERHSALFIYSKIKNDLSLEHLRTMTNSWKYADSHIKTYTQVILSFGHVIYFVIVSIARRRPIYKRRNNLRCLSHHSYLFSHIIIFKGTNSLAITTHNFAKSIAIQHSSVDVLEICVLAPLEKLLLQVSTARAVSGTCTNCTFSLGHLFLP